MHLYAYNDWDSPDEKSALTLFDPGPLVDEIFIMLDEDDEDDTDTEEDVFVPASQRPKVGLPKRFSSYAKKAEDRLVVVVREPMNVELRSAEAEIFQSITCTPGLRDKSFEVCVCLAVDRKAPSLKGRFRN